MATFTDAHGREWDFKVDVAVLRRVHAATGHYLTDLAELDSATYRETLTNPFLLADLLFATIEPQAKALDIGREAFESELAGDPYEQMTSALMESVVDFFRDGQRRALNRAMLAKAKEANRILWDRAAAEVEKTTPEAIAKAVEDAAKQSLKSATSLPDSSASTPEPSPGGN